MIRVLVLVPLLVLVLGSCGDETGPVSSKRDPNAPLEVLVVNYPLQYFAERIGGERVRVAFPAPRDVDPAFWSPEPEAIAGFQQADVILLNGAGYAKWIERATLPASKLVVTAAAAEDRFIEITSGVTHSHGPGATHSHEGTAFTTWLDPKIAVVQAEAVRDALVRARPEHRDVFTLGFARLEEELLVLDATLERITKTHRERPLVASHPVYQYFTRRYGLSLKSVHWEPDAAPDDTQWNELDELLRTHPATLMIWEGTPGQATVDALEKRGVASVVFEPCGNVPDDGDYLTVMKQNAALLEKLIGR